MLDSESPICVSLCLIGELIVSLGFASQQSVPRPIVGNRLEQGKVGSKFDISNLQKGKVDSFSYTLRVLQTWDYSDYDIPELQPDKDSERISPCAFLTNIRLASPPPSEV